MQSVYSAAGNPSFSHIRQANGYTADAFLGRGRFSETLLVHLRRNPSQLYVFKLVNRSVLHRLQEQGLAEHAEEIRRQLAVTRKINHPNLVSCIDIVDGKKGDCFIVQEYMRDGELSCVPPIKCDNSTNNGKNENDKIELSSKKEEVEKEENVDDIVQTTHGKCLRDLLVDVLRGLICLHDNGIPHLSLYPSNIFYDSTTNQYKLTDYGPVFVTADELAMSHVNHTELYALPSWLWSTKPFNGFYVDTFFVGLLAASTIPHIQSTVWPRVLRLEGESGEFDCNRLLMQVKAAKLPQTLTSFISGALSRGQDARTMLSHPFFEKCVDPHKIPITKITVTAVDLKKAVQPRPEVCDEPRMRDVLGQDPLMESELISLIVENNAEQQKKKSNPTNTSSSAPFESLHNKESITGSNDLLTLSPGSTTTFSSTMNLNVSSGSPSSLLPPNVINSSLINAGNNISAVAPLPSPPSHLPSCSINVMERPLIYTFRGPNLKCGQCGVEILVALFKCLQCTDCIRCGKCSVNGTHKDGHPLVPFVVHTIEHDRDGTSRAILFHPSCIQDVHILEEIEMRENFPLGALSGQLTTQRVAERSMMRIATSENIIRSMEEMSGESDSISGHNNSFTNRNGLNLDNVTGSTQELASASSVLNGICL